MTGRELIMLILEEHLEDNEIIDQHGRPAGMITAEEAANKFNVKVATVTSWMASGKLNSYLIGDTYYIPENSENPNRWDRKMMKKDENFVEIGEN